MNLFSCSHLLVHIPPTLSPSHFTAHCQFCPSSVDFLPLRNLTGSPAIHLLSAPEDEGAWLNVFSHLIDMTEVEGRC